MPSCLESRLPVQRWLPLARTSRHPTRWVLAAPLGVWAEREVRVHPVGHPVGHPVRVDLVDQVEMVPSSNPCRHSAMSALHFGPRQIR
jgi:hypothetical protein